MQESHESEHAAQEHAEGHGIHLPDPSIWPFVVGFAAFVAGIALIWWSEDPDSNFAGPLVGAALVLVLVSAAGWAWEDSRMRRKAAEGHGPEARDPRYTQVLTFAVAEGQLGEARGGDGVLTAIEGSDLRDLEGFEDLRVTVSPATEGPSQVLVETTWRGREGLTAYDGTRQTLLDIVTAHDTEVMPGTVQVFDMEVLRDTKDTAFRFPLGAMTAVVVGLVAGGFALGGALTLFESDAEAGGGEGGDGTPVPADPFTVEATDNEFGTSTLAAPPETEVTFTLVNEGQSPHNLVFQTAAGGETIGESDLAQGGEEVQVTFTTPAEGSYYFLCTVHPDQMNGTFNVTPDAPPPGGAPPAGEGDAGGPPPGGETIIATDNEFDRDSLQAAAGQEYSITLVNEGDIIHNISFYSEEGGELLAPEAEGETIEGGGATTTVAFTPAEPGDFYFQCDVHPDQMNGEFVVQ